MEKFCEKIIRWGFYALFFLVPLVFYAGSYELFEYNKMVLVYGLTIIIVAAWVIKGLKNFKRTPLDIPILLYLISHILSTFFSIDPHVSIWGYYSRFHEGLLATISYILLYYAAVSNLNRSQVINLLKLSFLSAAIVAIYGVFEHFGASPSCLFITGRFTVDCWVQDVKTRVFATLGQPNWMAAYLDIIILASLGFFSKRIILLKNDSFSLAPLLPVSLFFVALLFTKSRSGLLGLAAGLAVLAGALIYTHRENLKILLFNRFLILSSIVFLLSSIVFGLPFSQTEKFSMENFLTQKPATSNQQPATSNPGYIDIGISESGDIRRIVWQGALKIWQRYPIFGSGVETFAYAYYQDRPVEHNMVSEWDFLYNKAHNEYLNLLATTGTVGFLAYLSIIVVFSYWVLKFTIFSSKFTNEFQIVAKRENSAQGAQFLNFKFQIALFAAWVSILITNFFGFSVVVIGLFFFLIPALAFVLTEDKPAVSFSTSPIGLTSLICLIGLILEWNLVSMWRADKAFAYGRNLDTIQRYVDGYPYLVTAVSTNPNEPTFRDELAYNQSVLASTIFAQIQTSSASAVASLSAQQKLAITIPQLAVSTNDLIAQAIDNSNRVVTTSPNALTFWKTRTKVFYQLATIDNKYILDALAAIQKANELAPTDAKVHYNLGILYGRVGQVNNAITALSETVAMKPDYRDAYYALGLYYKEAGDTKKAQETMTQILTKIGPDPDAQKWLEENTR